MKPSWRKLMLILVFAFGYFPPTYGQAVYPWKYREWEVSGFAGGSTVPNFNFSTPLAGTGTSSTVGLRYASGYQVGIRVTEHFHEGWGADLEYNFANQPLTFTNLSPNTPSLSVSHDVHHFSYNIGYLARSESSRFRPYATVGVGAALFFIPGSSLDTALEQGVRLRDSWELAGNWGGGFKYLVQDQFAIRLDVKDQVSRVPSYGLPPSAQIINGQYLPGMAGKGLLNNFQINFGLAFQWDEY